MELSKIKEITTGFVRMWEEDGFVHLSRFTEKQDALLGSRGGFDFHKGATSSIKFEFTTCGGEISFDYKAEQGCGAGQFFGFDITVDGVPSFHFFKESLPEEGKVEYSVPVSEKPVHVVAYFPNMAKLQIKNLILPDDRKPVKKNLKLLAVGDSITQGIWSVYPSQTYINMVAKELDAELLNQAIGGDIFFADNLDEELPFDPDIVTVAYGVNDFVYSHLTKDGVRVYFERLYSLYKNKKIFVILPIWFGEEDKPVDGIVLDDGRKRIRSLAEQYPNITIIDGKDIIPHFIDFYWDEVCCHPNDLGYFYYGRKIADIIKKELGNV